MGTQEILAEYQRHPGDTGSPEAQIALMTDHIQRLTEHLRSHKGDHATRRGLQLTLGKRRRLCRYLANQDIERYRSLTGRLGIRGPLGLGASSAAPA